MEHIVSAHLQDASFAFTGKDSMEGDADGWLVEIELC